MKITRITPLVVNGLRANWVFVRVETDEPDLYGWGEATLERKTRAIVGAIEDLAPLFVGRDPRDIARHVDLAKKDAFWPLGLIGMSALSGIEQALWDIFGKSLGLPVWRMLGGQCRERVRVYTHIGRGIFEGALPGDKTQYVEGAQELVELGYTAIKFNPIPHTGYETRPNEVRHVGELLMAVREGVGTGVDLMVDLLGRPASVRAAIDYIEAMEPARLMWAEEPIQPGDPASLRMIADRVRTPIATGERLVTQKEFQDLATCKAVTIAQPDLCHCGGLLEGMRIAATCAAHGIGIAPHNPQGPISSVVALHFAVATPNFVIQEEMAGCVPWYYDVVKTPIRMTAGWWDVPTSPGLGIEVDLKAAERHPFAPVEQTLKPAVLADGSIVTR